MLKLRSDNQAPPSDRRMRWTWRQYAAVPSGVAHFFPALDPRQFNDSKAADVGSSILEDFLAERFLTQDGA